MARPIATLKELSLELGKTPHLLLLIASKTDSLYRLSMQKKKTGEPRETFDAFEPLKSIQRKIVNAYFSSLTFPHYLHGAVRDENEPRGVYSNALAHSRSNYFIFLDIENYFASISSTQVSALFAKFFNCELKTSWLLAGLATYKNGLAPGASTSNYIANLLFWDLEPSFVEFIEKQGLVYTRFIDDIIISSRDVISKQDISEIISKAVKMFSAKGCKLKRRKLHIRKRGQYIDIGKNTEPITITGFGIHNFTPGVSKAERRKIRSAVFQLERQFYLGNDLPRLDKEYQRIMGRLAKLDACDHLDGARLKARLRKIKALGSDH